MIGNLLIFGLGVIAGLLSATYYHHRKTRQMKAQLRAYPTQVLALKDYCRRLELINHTPPEAQKRDRGEVRAAASAQG